MSKKLWKCYNCPSEVPGRKFHEWQGLPKCPKCGTSKSDKTGGELIVERRAIHYDAPHPTIKNRGIGTRACDGQPIRGEMATGEVSAVTCPDCLATEQVRLLLEEQGVPVVVASHDFEVEIEGVPNGS